MDTKQLVQEVLQKQGITAYRLGKEMKLGNSTVYQWLNGTKSPSGKHVLELLHRAGKLAAAVLIGAVVGLGSEIQSVEAKPSPTATQKTTVYYVKYGRWGVTGVFLWIFNMLGFRPLKQV